MLSFIHNLHLGKKYFSNIFFLLNFFLKNSFFQKAVSRNYNWAYDRLTKNECHQGGSRKKVSFNVFLVLDKKIFFQCFFSSEDVEEKIQKLQNECLSFLKHSFTNWIQKDILKVISDWTQQHHEYLGLFFNKFFPFLIQIFFSFREGKI